MELLRARRIAEGLLGQILPYCHRAEIAGSVRRGSREVKDIEIVAVPKWESRPTGTDLFGEETEAKNLLYENWAEFADLTWIKPGTCRIAPGLITPEGKYWRGLLPEGLKLDLFLCRRKNWGYQLTIRTGPADFSAMIVTWAALRGYPCRGGYVWCGDERQILREEEEFFRLIDLNFIPPEDRDNRELVRAAGLRLPRREAHQ